MFPRDDFCATTLIKNTKNTANVKKKSKNEQLSSGSESLVVIKQGKHEIVNTRVRAGEVYEVTVTCERSSGERSRETSRLKPAPAGDTNRAIQLVSSTSVTHSIR